MRRLFPVSALVGSAMLVLAGCSSAPADRDASEDVADLGDTPSAVVLECTGKQQSLAIPKDATSVSITAVGAAGWALEEAGSDEQGMGGSVVAVYTLSKGKDGSTLYAKVGCEGSGKGSGGFPDGGKADDAGNHGGGGSTGLYRDGSGGDATDPIVIAGGGGGAPRGGKFAGGSVLETGIGGAGEGPEIEGKPSCGGGGGQKDKAGTAVDVGQYGPAPWPGKNGNGQKGGAVESGDVGGPGGAGGGGHYGGAGGCAASFLCSGCLGAGGAGSSYVDPSVEGPTFASETNKTDGYLGLTFMCGETKCTTQPTPTTSSA